MSGQAMLMYDELKRRTKNKECCIVRRITDPENYISLAALVVIMIKRLVNTTSQCITKHAFWIVRLKRILISWYPKWKNKGNGRADYLIKVVKGNSMLS